MFDSLKIIAVCIAAAVTYGMLHDQVTARVCVEYFTIGHVRVIASESPTRLALVWGVLATWWVGLGLGIPVALFARWGRRPKLAWRDLTTPLAVLMIATAVVSLISGLVGFELADLGFLKLNGRLGREVPPDCHVRFLADLWAHRAAYATGSAGSVLLCGWCVWRRGQRFSTTRTPPGSPRW